MISQCAKAATAKEAAFRVDYPNSARRGVKLVALDDRSLPAVERLLRADPRRTALLPPALAVEVSGDAQHTIGSIKAALGEFAVRTKALIAEIDPADLVVLVATAGEEVPLATVVGEACRTRGVPVTALVLDMHGATDAELATTLSKLRSYAAMLVVAREGDYIEEMLAALRG